MNQQIQSLAKGYEAEYRSETSKGKKLFLANLRHAVATWDTGVDRQACQKALKLIEGGVS